MSVSTPAPGVLRSRLVAPRLPPACVARPELVSTVVKGLSGRLVAMVAGAGFGKTTLLTLALHEDSMPFVWVSCDERMTSARSLLAHLVAGIAERFPGFGARIELAGDLDDQAVALSNEISETVADPFILALDDVHTLVGQPSGSAGRAPRARPAADRAHRRHQPEPPAVLGGSPPHERPDRDL